MFVRNGVVLGAVATGALAFAATSGADSITVSNPQPIVINDTPTDFSLTPASPASSPVTLPAVAVDGGTRLSLSLTVNGFTHSSPGDVRMALTSPSGQSTLFMNLAGDGFGQNGQTLMFVPNGARIPFLSPWTGGTFGSSIYNSSGTPSTTNLFGQLVALPGSWALAVSDQLNGDSGVIGGGWSLTASGSFQNEISHKIKRNKRKGTATATLKVPNPGVLELVKNSAIKGAKLNVSAAGTYKIKIRTRGQATKRLKKKGWVKANIRFRFTPTGGTANSEPDLIVLKKTK